MASDTTTIALAQFLRNSMNGPFSFHSNNCGMWVSDWVKTIRGIDPAASVRGYAPRAFHRLLKDHGGVESLARILASEASLEITDNPEVGDIGVVQSPNGPMLAIKSKTGWIAKCDVGVLGASYSVIIAWKV